MRFFVRLIARLFEIIFRAVREDYRIGLASTGRPRALK
jgi:hypothetical protein